VLAGLLSMTVVGTVVALRFSSLRFRPIGMATAVVGLVLACMVAATYLLQYVRGSDCEIASDENARAEAYWIKSSRRDIVAGIRARYTAEIPPNVFRILVVGTSQTCGRGRVRMERPLCASSADSRHGDLAVKHGIVQIIAVR
jgi:hypothetical protein